jgi:hypothetical protein
MRHLFGQSPFVVVVDRDGNVGRPVGARLWLILFVEVVFGLMCLGVGIGFSIFMWGISGQLMASSVYPLDPGSALGLRVLAGVVGFISGILVCPLMVRSVWGG